jgi:hypothetical protein
MHCDLQNSKNIPEHFNFVEEYGFVGVTSCSMLEYYQRFCFIMLAHSVISKETATSFSQMFINYAFLSSASSDRNAMRV